MNNNLVYKKVSYALLSLVFSISVFWIISYFWSFLNHDSYGGNSLAQMYFIIAFSPVLYIFLIAVYFVKYKNLFDYIVASVIAAIIMYIQYSFLSFVPIYYSFIAYILGVAFGFVLNKNSK